MEKLFTINEQNVLQVFLDKPTALFTIRELARLTGITHPTAAEAVKALRKAGLVTKNVRPKDKKSPSSQAAEVFWQANIDEKRYKLAKKIQNLKRLAGCGLVEEIATKTSPNAIVLFGSYLRGEDIESSDIDLFVVSSETQVDLRRYEKMLKRKINITFESDPFQLTKELLSNLVNGIVLYGYFEAVR